MTSAKPRRFILSHQMTTAVAVVRIQTADQTPWVPLAWSLTWNPRMVHWTPIAAFPVLLDWAPALA